MASSSAVSVVSGVKVESSVEPGGEIGVESGTDGACVSMCTVGGVLVWSCRPVGRLAAGTRSCLSRGSFVPFRPFGQNKRAADPEWGSAALKAPA
ncbi:hypothetical protein GCM10010284_58150 [Streptomyces rubiginosohelvolus]|uniref:Uncharacterized protein n=1 Tax=Streptomyces rubiginosohelvolus TaxID=67362 RepID=A0ABQ3BCH2_9ACTN|nr:hypothetical protein GCM10010284_58150 [Streptomyces rubiginosohelvolus]GGZ35251.1 hypothetical protein GCM10010328_05730 [Streptomyces pluricolorescens]